jgi:hypothetical protein
MRYEKNHLRFTYNGQMRNELVKAAVNGLRICKLRSGVKKTPQFLLFSMVKGGPSVQ